MTVVRPLTLGAWDALSGRVCFAAMNREPNHVAVEGSVVWAREEAGYGWSVWLGVGSA